ncbi:LacI family DNA-binding transcriptional regulator [Pseudoclavibacter sp. AY1F1]|uniref:LacI family DNA-binding transcriptional regulator n=1 Tax=Pseudoclavibacter sp. AY1F1 TaxID=2080583 RepID=UPI0011B072B6|nr:LacI family DNA-binding transcriptional regulator [Pseudoclavibacter sp. AY1F1]
MADREKARASAPTIYDIASLAGVSASTVSRALNKPGRINAETASRIQQAADQLGYRTNPMARSLQTGLTGNLALVVSDLTNPVYFNLVRGAERVTAEARSMLLFADSQEDGAVEAEAADRLLRVADGLILVGSRLADEEIVALSNIKPVVVVNRVVEGVAGVTVETSAGARAIVQHLHSLGHRHIAYVPGPAASWMNARRSEAIISAAAELGIVVRSVASSGPTVDGGRFAVPGILETGATAVVAYNDLLAFGVIHGLRGTGAHVPADVSVVGFDDIFGSELLTPSLTTVRSPLAQLGESAVKLLQLQIAGSAQVTTDQLSTELIVRDSTGPAAS